MRIDIWFDYVCPFCYMGERKFQNALTMLKAARADEGAELEVETHYHAFQLGLNKANIAGKDIHQIIAEKYHITYEQAKANNEQIIKAAKAVGLNYNFDIMKPSSTQAAHELTQYAALIAQVSDHKGTQVVHDVHPLIQRLYKAYFEEGANLDDPHTLAALSVEAYPELGPLPLTIPFEHLSTVREKITADQREAQNLGINGVPYFLIDGKRGISGAQSPEHFLAALRSAL